MEDFFNNMTVLQQTYWGIALLGSLIFVIIFITTFIGGAGDSDMVQDGTDFEADDGGVGFQFFTFKNIIAFFTVFGWVGIICLDNSFSNLKTVLFATLSGLVMMVLTSSLFFYMSKLAQSGTLKIKNSIGAVGEVYLPIGAKRSSIGKVQLKVQGSLRELEAITDSEVELKTSTIIKVKEVVSSELLLVEKLSS